MDPVPVASRCTCSPKLLVEGKEYPPQAGEGNPVAEPPRVKEPGQARVSIELEEKS